jgi:Fe-S cluster biogenesis protein NfuA
MSEMMTNNPVNGNNPAFTVEESVRALVGQLDTYITQYHGGSVEMVALENNVLKVRLGGACLGCPLSPVTLKGWVAGTVRQFFPEIERVESV